MGLFLFFLIQHLFKHFGFNTHYFDLYFKDHTTWNLTQGQGLYLSIHNKPFFADHFYPIFYAISLLYFIKATPVWLFIIHALCLTLTALPILKLAKNTFGKKGMLITFGLMLAYYPFRRANLDYLHGEVVMAPLIAWICYFLYYNRFTPAILLTLLFALTKETAAVILVMLGLYITIFKKRAKLGLTITLYGIAWGLFIFKVFFPHFQEEGYAYISRYSHLGDSFKTILQTLLTHPLYVLKHLLSLQNIGYLFGLLAPLCFLPLFSGFIVIGFGVLLQNMLSDVPSMTDIGAHYSIQLIPILFIGAIATLKKIQVSSQEKWTATCRFLKPMVLFFVSLNLLAFIFMDIRVFILSPQVKQNYDLIKQVPPQATLSASSRFLVHTHYRPHITFFPHLKGYDYVLVDGDDPNFPPDKTPIDFIKEEWQKGSKLKVLKALLMGEKSFSPINRKDHMAALEALKKNTDYELIAKKGESYLFKKK